MSATDCGGAHHRSMEGSEAGATASNSTTCRGGWPADMSRSPVSRGQHAEPVQARQPTKVRVDAWLSSAVPSKPPRRCVSTFWARHRHAPVDPGCNSIGMLGLDGENLVLEGNRDSRRRFERCSSERSRGRSVSRSMRMLPSLTARSPPPRPSNRQQRLEAYSERYPRCTAE